MTSARTPLGEVQNPLELSVLEADPLPAHVERPTAHAAQRQVVEGEVDCQATEPRHSKHVSLAAA